MLETPEIIDVPPQTSAVIRLRIPSEECRQHWGTALAELFAELDRQGLAPAGSVFDHHFRMPDTHFDFEIGVPVSEAVNSNGRVIPSERPAFSAVRAVLVGDYKQLPEAWPEFMRWSRIKASKPPRTSGKSSSRARIPIRIPHHGARN